MANIEQFSSKSEKHVVRAGSVFLYLTLIVLEAYFVVLPFRNVQIRHAITFIGSMFFIGRMIVSLLKTKYSYREFTALIIIVLILLAGILRSTDIVGFKLIYVSLDYLTLFLLFLVVPLYALTPKDRKVMEWFTVLYTATFLILSRSSVAYLFEDGANNGSLALGMTNPNLTGMILSGILGISIISLREKERNKVFLVLSITILFILIYLTQSRSAFICGILMLIYTFLFSKRRIPKAFIYFSLIVPVLAPFIYISFYRGQRLLNLNLLDKTFYSGRQFIYQNLIFSQKSLTDLLFGNLEKYQFNNATNAPLTLFLSLGLVGLLTSFVVFTRRVLILNDQAGTHAQRSAIVCILCLFIESAAESFMFTGQYPGICIVYFMILLMSNAQEEH